MLLHNPELMRNLWIEFRGIKGLILPPLALIILFLVVAVPASKPLEVLMIASVSVITLAALIGVGQAFKSVADEVKERTWDFQRMSALSPWQMVWGKLFGATSYTWYVIILVVPVLALSLSLLDPFMPTAVTIANGLAAILLFESIFFVLALDLVERKKLEGSGGVPFAIIVLAGCFLVPYTVGVLFVLLEGSAGVGPPLLWYGTEYTALWFGLGSCLIFIAWTFCGAYRLMRAELQYVCLPWAWPLFQIFLAAYLCGFPQPMEVKPNVHYAFGTRFDPVGTRLWLAYGLFMALLYLTLLSDPPRIVALKRVSEHWQAKKWQSMARSIPRWCSSYGLLAVVTILFYAGCQTDAARMTGIFFIASRDVCLVLGFSFLGLSPGKASVGLIVSFVMLYWLVPALLKITGLSAIALVFQPWYGKVIFSQTVPALLGFLAMLMWAYTRWRRASVAV